MLTKKLRPIGRAGPGQGVRRKFLSCCENLMDVILTQSVNNVNNHKLEHRHTGRRVCKWAWVIYRIIFIICILQLKTSYFCTAVHSRSAKQEECAPAAWFMSSVNYSSMESFKWKPREMWLCRPIRSGAERLTRLQWQCKRLNYGTWIGKKNCLYFDNKTLINNLFSSTVKGPLCRVNCDKIWKSPN